MIALVLLVLIVGLTAGIVSASRGSHPSAPVAVVSTTAAPSTEEAQAAAASPTTLDVSASAASEATGETPPTTASPATIATTSPAPTTTLSTIIMPAPTTLLASQLVQVVDGDTIVVKLDSGNRERVALIGIDAPEKGNKGSAQPTAYLEQLLTSGPIGLELGKQQRDKYGRLRAYIWVGPLFVNREMLAKGLAKIVAASVDVPEYLPLLAAAQTSAQTTFQGRWATTTTGQ